MEKRFLIRRIKMNYKAIKNNKIVTEINSTETILMLKEIYPDFDDILSANHGKIGDDIREYTEQGEKRPLHELTDEGIIQIPAGKKIQDNIFVDMTLEEKVENGLLPLHPDEHIVDGFIRKKITAQEGIEIISRMCFDKREKVFPEYKYLNLLAEVEYEEPYTITNYRATVEGFRKIYYDNKVLIENARTSEEIQDIVDSVSFPDEVIRSQ